MIPKDFKILSHYMENSTIKYIREIVPSIESECYENPKSPFANWIIPNFAMAGIYPYVDGINIKTHEEAERNFKYLQEDGINTFICLQAEINCNGASIKGHPYFPEYEWYKKHHPNINFHFFPIIDGGTTSNDNICAVIGVILNHIASGDRVYIHCAGGHGRTGMIAACLLKTIYSHITMSSLLETVQALHDTRQIPDQRTAQFQYRVKSPNSRVQIQSCYEYEKHL